jgi:hypothetical protein
MRSTVLLVSLLAASPALSYEGKWTPQQVLELGDPQLQRLGLQLPARRLWDPEKGSGLLSGAVWGNSCSGALISESGLLLTNHHCLFSLLQQHSTPERDLMKTGYLARTRAEELPGLTEKVRVPRKFRDVTKEILAAVPKDADDLQRRRAIERKRQELVAECEKRPAHRCSVASFDDGHWYTLVETLEISDVRLVYAPPRAVGEFGGEIDNWSWPRHSPDFAIARLYVGRDGTPGSYWEHNVPYKPEHFFTLSTEGVKPDDFVMVLGYPGRTYRSLTAAEVAERTELFFPAREALYAEWARLLEEAAGSDPRGQIAVADDVKTLQNRRKHAEGMLAAFARGQLLERRREEEATAEGWGRRRWGWDEALAAREALEALAAEDRKTFHRDFLIDHLEPGGSTFVKSLGFATTLARLALESEKPDLERDPAFMDRNLLRIRDGLEREHKRLFLPAERAVLVSFLKRARRLPEGQRIAALEKAFSGVAEKDLPAAVDALFSKTRVLDAAERLKMAKEGTAALRARKDPLVELGFGLAQELEARRERRDRREGASARLRPAWRKLVIAHAGRTLDPDANGTLRVSFARVKGYEPMDGVIYAAQTTLNGMLAKDKGREPFAVPSPMRQAALERRHGRWADKRMRDVPVNFLSDADTSSGNSGSPVLNAKGELVGVNFDRVWENVANDFGYNPAVARNISADVRCLLWMLDQVEDADELLKELNVRKRLQTLPPAR